MTKEIHNIADETWQRGVEKKKSFYENERCEKMTCYGVDECASFCIHDLIELIVIAFRIDQSNWNMCVHNSLR